MSSPHRPLSPPRTVLRRPGLALLALTLVACGGGVSRPELPAPSESVTAALAEAPRERYLLSMQAVSPRGLRGLAAGEVDTQTCALRMRTAAIGVSQGPGARTTLTVGEIRSDGERAWYLNEATRELEDAEADAVEALVDRDVVALEDIPDPDGGDGVWTEVDPRRGLTEIVQVPLIGLAPPDVLVNPCEALARIGSTSTTLVPLQELRDDTLAAVGDQELVAADVRAGRERLVGRFSSEATLTRVRADLWDLITEEGGEPTAEVLNSSTARFGKLIEGTRVEVVPGEELTVIGRGVGAAVAVDTLVLRPLQGGVEVVRPEKRRRSAKGS